MIKQDSVNPDTSIFSITVDTFHTVITDFIRIKITAVAFAAANTLPVVENTLFMYGHRTEHLPFYGSLYIEAERTVKLIHD